MSKLKEAQERVKQAHAALLRRRLKKELRRQKQKS